MHVFRDRRDAGRQLAQRLEHFAGHADVVVIALPRGGVPVGYEIANRLGAPLDVMIVRKLGVPGQEELAMGAIASGGIRVLDERAIRLLGLSDEELERLIEAEQTELERRERLYRTRSAGSVAGKIVILVDDGLATGATMAAAIDAVRTRAPGRVIVAVPVAPPEICKALGRRADAIVCLVTPEQLYAVGLWYEDFTQTTDDEVRELLERAECDREARLAAEHYGGA